jgi:hypothetical protein
MNDSAMRSILGVDIPAGVSHGEEASSLLVDTAISHCEKLRRVLELEEWIAGARDSPLLAATCRKWQEMRRQLLAELQLEPAASHSTPKVNSAR